jgi:hypothetical protein
MQERATEQDFPMHTETEPARVVSPEEEKLENKRRELARLLSELVERELSLVSLNADLAAFEGQYLHEFGVMYAQLANAPKLLLTATPLKNSLIGAVRPRNTLSVPVGSPGGMH